MSLFAFSAAAAAGGGVAPTALLGAVVGGPMFRAWVDEQLRCVCPDGTEGCACAALDEAARAASAALLEAVDAYASAPSAARVASAARAANELADALERVGRCHWSDPGQGPAHFRVSDDGVSWWGALGSVTRFHPDGSVEVCPGRLSETSPCYYREAARQRARALSGAPAGARPLVAASDIIRPGSGSATSVDVLVTVADDVDWVTLEPRQADGVLDAWGSLDQWCGGDLVDVVQRDPDVRAAVVAAARRAAERA